jgi:hypothetical protein
MSLRAICTTYGRLNLFSSAIKLNTQYMHSIWFHLKVKRRVTLDEVIGKPEANKFVALTEKAMANPIFSFGRSLRRGLSAAALSLCLRPGLTLVRRGWGFHSAASCPSRAMSTFATLRDMA